VASLWALFRGTEADLAKYPIWMLHANEGVTRDPVPFPDSRNRDLVEDKIVTQFEPSPPDDRPVQSIDHHELPVTQLTMAELHLIASGGPTEDEMKVIPPMLPKD
jgi:hypothetical protein